MQVAVYILILFCASDACVQLMYSHTYDPIADGVFNLVEQSDTVRHTLSHMALLVNADQICVPFQSACDYAGLCSVGEVLLQCDWR